jgi:hypothetical protein
MAQTSYSERQARKNNQWPVKILVDPQSVERDVMPVSGIASIYCLVKFELATGVKEVELRRLNMVTAATGARAFPSPTLGVELPKPSQWHDGMKITTNTVLDLRFFAAPNHRYVYFEVTANGEVCKSAEMELPG